MIFRVHHGRGDDESGASAVRPDEERRRLPRHTIGGDASLEKRRDTL